ncbi:TonB-dependent receptor domain-containing protein [Cupriavidus basilensis]
MQTADYDKSALTPALGLVVKPWTAQVSLYANYIEGLSQGDTVTDVTARNYGQVFAPYKSKQMEAGVKWDAGRDHQHPERVSDFQAKHAQGHGKQYLQR